MLTSSLGWTGCFEPISPPASSMARFEITSFTFMFVCVPLPVCQTNNGNSSGSFPATISSAAVTRSRALSAGSFPSPSLTSAAAFFSTAMALITAVGIRSPTMEKWCKDRCVCAPQ